MRSSSGDASSFSAITAISIPWLRAPSSTRKGKRPFPAIKPQPETEVATEAAFGAGDDSCGAISALLDEPALGSLDEFDQLFDVFRVSQRFAHASDCLRSIQFRAGENPVSLFDGSRAVGSESLALESNFVCAEAARLPFGDHHRKRRYILRNHCERADVGV